MIKTFISLLIILIFVSTKVQSLDLIEEILNEIKQINQKVDLLNEKADDNHKIIEIMQEEVRKNFTNIGNDLKVIKMLEEKTKENSEILKKEFPSINEDCLNITKENSEILKNEVLSLKEDLSSVTLNIRKVEQEVIKTEEKMTTSFNDIFNKVEPMKDEIKRSLENFDDQIKSLDQEFVENNLKVTSIEFKSDNIIESVANIEMLVKGLDYGGSIVISSEGSAAEKYGSRLGQYQFDKLRKVFVQLSTEKENEKYNPHYLYQTTNMQWWIGDESGKENGLLKNEEKTGGPEDVPLSNWLVKDGDSWEIDHTIKITREPLTPACKTIKIEATGTAAEEQLMRLGDYQLSNRWYNGHPVYQHDNGQLLYTLNNKAKNIADFWGVSKTLGWYGIRGSPIYLCPSKSTKWEYWVESTSEFKLGNITVTCTDQ